MGQDYPGHGKTSYPINAGHIGGDLANFIETVIGEVSRWAALAFTNLLRNQTSPEGFFAGCAYSE